jgi:hypothetical protein
MDKYIYDFMAASIEVAATNPMVPLLFTMIRKFI